MQNRETNTISTQISPATLGQALMLSQGYLDGALGKPFGPYYERAQPLLQRAYEHGRLCAINLRAAGLKPVPWDDPTSFPPDLIRAVQKSVDLVGDFEVTKR